MFANGAETCHVEVVKLKDEQRVKMEPMEKSVEEVRKEIMKIAGNQLKRYVVEQPPTLYFRIQRWGTPAFASIAYIQY